LVNQLIKQLGKALANNMHFRGRSKHIALRMCFIQKLIQDRILNISNAPERDNVVYWKTNGKINNDLQCPTTVQTADIRTKALPRVPFDNFTDQLLGNKHVGDK